MIGEQYGDSTQLLYLRARYYNPTDGRFINKDPSRLESNLYLYAQGNPVNRVDPTGLFSMDTIQKNIPLTDFAVTPYNATRDHSKWGFYALLRYAENGDRVQTGYVPLA